MSMYEAYSRTGLIFGNSGGGGGGGTTNFEELNNRPKVNDNLIDKNSTNASLEISKTYTLNITRIEDHMIFEIPVETVTDIYNMMAKGAICILSNMTESMHRLVSSADTDGEKTYVTVQYDDILVKYADDGTYTYKERVEVDEDLSETSMNPVMNKSIFSELAKKSTVYDYTLVVDEDHGNYFIDADGDGIPIINVFSELLEHVLERNNTNVFINVVYPDPDEEGYTPVVTKVPYVLIDADDGDGFVFSAKYRNVEAAISVTADRATFEIIEKEDYTAGEGIDITDFEISSSYGTYQPAFRVPSIELNEGNENYKRYTTYNGNDYLEFMFPDGVKLYMFGRKNPYTIDDTQVNELNEDQKAQLHEITGQTFLTGMYVPFNVGASLTTVLNNIISENDDIFSPIDDGQPVLIFMAAMTDDTKFRFLYLTDRPMNLSEFKIESLTKKEIYKIPEKALNIGRVEESSDGLVTGKKVYKAITPDRFEVAIDMETLQVNLPTTVKYGKVYSTKSELFNDITNLIDHDKQVIAVVKMTLNENGDYGYFEFPMLASYHASDGSYKAVLFNQTLGSDRYEIQIAEIKTETETEIKMSLEVISFMEE